MSLFTVSGNTLTFQGKSYVCAIGKGGFSASKKEGDGATPLGIFALRECWYRADRIAKPQTKLPLRIIHENDGWCDDPTSADYNRHIKLPHPARHENLFRDDHVYDLIIPLGYNDDPVVASKGSAIFMHIVHNDYRGTEGCIALAKPDLLEILRHSGPDSVIDIQKG